MWNKVRITGAASANSILRKVVTTAVAFGLAASFTLGAAPVSATPAPSYNNWALEVDNTTPQWGDEVSFDALIDWSSCKRIPTVYLLGTADNGDPISQKLTGVLISSKTYGYTVTYGGVDESGAPYDSELTQAERATLGDHRLPAGWNSFSLMATSTQLNCGFKKIYTDTAVDFFVGPKLDGITLTTSATHELSVDTTAGLVVLTDGDGYDFTSGIYEYEATSQLGDTSSELWFDDGEMVGDTLTVDVNERDDWDGNPSGVNCYLDAEVVSTGDTVVDGHHSVDDADAVDCASIPVDDLGEHTLTIERWIDSCDDGCLSWSTYTIYFARVENQDAVPYSLDLLDASTGASLPDDSFDWNDPTTGNNIDLAPDNTNGIEIQADVPFGADLSCEYDEDGIALAPGDMFQPLLNAGDTYLVCTVTPEDPSAASFTYTVTIHRYSSNVVISSINVYRGDGVGLHVTQDPVDYTSEVDYSSGMALYSDDTVGIEVVPQDLETEVTCYRDAELTDEDDCANFDLNTPYDSTTGAWILLTAEDGSEQDYHLVIEHTVLDPYEIDSEEFYAEYDTGLLDDDQNPVDTFFHGRTVDWLAYEGTYDDTIGIVTFTLYDEDTAITCYETDATGGIDYGSEVPCDEIPLSTPDDASTGVWVKFTAQGTGAPAPQWQLVVFTHTTIDRNSDLQDATVGLQFSDSYESPWDVGDCADLSYGFDGDDEKNWCVRFWDAGEGLGGDWVQYATDDSTGSILTALVSAHATVECDGDRFPGRGDGDCNDLHLASRTDNSTGTITNGENWFDVTVTAQDDSTTVYRLYVERVDNNSMLQNLIVLNDSASSMEFDSDFSSTDYEYHVDVYQADLTGNPAGASGTGLDAVATLIDAGAQHFRANPNKCTVGYTDGVDPLVGDLDCSNIVIPSDADDDYVIVIRVFAENGTHSDYTLYFTFKAESDYLSTLEVNGDAVDNNVDSTVGVEFDEGAPGTTWYFTTSSATATVTSAFITPTESDLLVTCYVASVLVSCTNIALTQGDTKTIQVRVYKDASPDVLRHTYTVNVYRRSNVKTLGMLSATGGRSLSPTFASGTLSYTATLGSSTFDVTYTPTSDKATAECVAVYDSSNNACDEIPTDMGVVVVTVTVTAENGDQQSYVISFSNGPRPQYVTKAKVSGTNTVGKKLTAVVGTWRYGPSYSYLWYACTSGTTSTTVTTGLPSGCSTTGVTTSTFTLASGQRGSKMMVRITGTNANGSTVIYTALTLVVK